MKEDAIDKIAAVILTYRRSILCTFAIVTAALGYQAQQIRIDAGFEKLLPLSHPFMRTFVEYANQFGGANRILIAVRARDGDIFDPQFFDTLQRITDEVFFLPGVNRSSVRSIFTPNVRFVEIIEGGFAGGNVIPADFEPTPESLERVRENIAKADLVGRLVASDFSAAIVSADLLDRAPGTGESLDYLEIARQLEGTIRDRYVDDEIDVHIQGFAKIIGDIADSASDVLALFGITFGITAILVYAFTRSWKLSLLPLACSLIAVVWTLGLLRFFGFGLDPMSILVPFLVFAIGISHGVQMVNAAGLALRSGASTLVAAREALSRLLVPASAALLSDALGFLTILLIDIQIIQEMALTASIGVSVTILTNLLLLPVLLSLLRSDTLLQARIEFQNKPGRGVWSLLARLGRPGQARVIVLCSLALLVSGLFEARNLKIGDLHPGVPELRPDSRYNRDATFVSEHFSVGVDMLQVIVESIPDGCIQHDVMTEIDRFQWHMTNVPGVRSTLSLPQLAKVVNAGWNEGSLKWRVLPRNQNSLSQAVAPIETSTGLLNHDCSVMPVLIFTSDHEADTVERVVDAVRTYAAANDNPRHVFRLATGNIGVIAATNEVVAHAQVPILIYVYLAVIALCALTFRSVAAVLCIVVPLALVSVLVYALMSLMSIGLKVSTLPVAALGVGIGVDYGIYLYASLTASLRQGLDFPEAWLRTLRSRGKAVTLTGLTLTCGVSTWVFSSLQFQADMGILLAFMFVANLIGALVLLPALALTVSAAQAQFRAMVRALSE